MAATPVIAQDVAPISEPASNAAQAEGSDVVVFGRGEAQIGTAQAASEGTVSGGDLLIRPLVKVAELLEAVPGMVAAQHSGTGKANQYFLRGFNLDHGSDFAAYIDGVPMNMRTHGHGQGYLDLNGYIPELTERESYRKGPYRADGGDLALAGAAYLQTVDRFARPWASMEVGSFGWGRLAAGGTADVGETEFTLVGQARIYDGPWEEPEHLRAYAGFAKLSTPAGNGRLALSLHAYRGTWRPTEQIPERIIGSPSCKDVYCSPDPTARGETTRLVANIAYVGEQLTANAYAQFYDWSMSSNPTYANADGSSAQIFQFDRRAVFGLRAGQTFHVTPALKVTIGTDNRYDAIDNVGVYQTSARRFVESFGAYAVGEGSAALFGEAEWSPLPPLRITGGLRADYYAYKVRASDAAATALGSGSGDTALPSPKVGAAWRFGDRVELYANYGRGFHSNDVRGAVTAMPVPVLVKGTGKELGARFQASGLTLTATYWWLDVGSELRFIGDSNAVEPTGASRRHGWELVGFWRPMKWLALDGNFTVSHSRYDNGDRIPNAFENAGQVGASLLLGRWTGSLRFRHLGPYPLVEDGTVRDHGSDVLNLRAAWKPGAVELFAELTNALGSGDKDIAYYYESYIPAFDSAPTEGRLSRVVEPRTLRAGVKLQF